MHESEPVTVVIPVYGPGPHLNRALDALEKQTVPVGNVIISHSGHGHPTGLLGYRKGIEVLHSDQRLFAGAARNRGLRLANTDWVVFVDEDIIVDANWHQVLLGAIESADVACIVGSIGYARPGGYWGMSRWFVEFSSVHPYLTTKPISAGASANMAVHRTKFESVGAFPEDWRMSQDTVACVRLRANGMKIRFQADAVGRHINVPGFRSMVRHLYHLGRFSAKLRREYPDGTVAGAAAKWPVLSFGLWLARLAQIYGRVLLSRHGPFLSVLLHTPGILLGLAAWNTGFASEALRLARSKSDY